MIERFFFIRYRGCVLFGFCFSFGFLLLRGALPRPRLGSVAVTVLAVRAASSGLVPGCGWWSAGAVSLGRVPSRPAPLRCQGFNFSQELRVRHRSPRAADASIR